MISIRHLSKSFPQPGGTPLQVLRDVNCDIHAGEVIAVIGPSGSGKSTLLHCLNLLEIPSGGEIIVDGNNILQKGYPVNQLRQKMGMVFQSFNLFSHLTVLDNITLAPMKLLGLSREQAVDEAMEILRKVAMVEKAHAMPDILSGGQKQRVAIARCLAMKPDIILFDEPTSALDPTMVGEVQGVIRQLAQEKMTMLIVTHEMKFARDIATRVLYMDNGVILEDGTPEQIFSNPQNEATRTFVNRIRSLTFDINNRDFDFYDMTSRIKQFCIRCALSEKMDSIIHVIEEMLLLMEHYGKPVHIEVNYCELDYTATVVIMHKDESVSPLEREDADELAVMIIRGMSKEITTEQTPEGIKVIFSM